MAYFSNDNDGYVFEKQCAKCKYGLEACPIFKVQTEYNYDACNNEVATNILNDLVKDDGTCTMFITFEKDFFVDKNQMELF